MDKIDWKHKLTSRKFWVAVVGLATGLILAFGGNEATAQTVGGCIMSAASVIAYILGEGLTDAARTNGAAPKEHQPQIGFVIDDKEDNNDE